ncbi:MAG: DUF2490 domain-containing protein [Candidatus Sphingomonas colombiensis]|nr:DUF2490 domain-containing protein [Sphingomonas sp.]WEK43012.1 MAG: DUF2490 domain-containing protein [Sphingomonas sp.]
MLKTLTCCLVGLATAAFPAKAMARDDAQLWLTVAGAVDLGDGWRLSQEAITRISDTRRGLYEIESNILVGYRVAPRLTLWAGYTHDPNYEAGRFAVMEHRGREQVTLDDIRIGRVRANFRLRGEQRWREGTEGTGWRLRPFVRVALPFQTNGTTGVAISHESFINLNRTAFQPIRGVDRMRNAIAFYTPLAKGVNVELGYLNQYSFAATGASDHAATASLSFAFR